MVVALLLGAGGSYRWYRANNARVPLLSATVGLDAEGRVRAVAPDESTGNFVDDTRVLDLGGTSAELAEEQREWLTTSGRRIHDAEYADMVEKALLDVKTLILPNGASVAGWPDAWRYVWPRDSSFAAVALARAGHHQDALQIMMFLQSVQPPSGVFQARYLPDGSGPPDGRGEQTDGTGFALWAVADMVDSAGSAAQRQEVLTSLRPLIDTSTAAAVRITSPAGSLPSASGDYWEVHDKRLSLGTVAPLACGIAAAVRLYAALGANEKAQELSAHVAALDRTIAGTFGSQDYPRYLSDKDKDASLAFLLPPFRDRSDAAVVAAWRRAAIDMRRPAGGLAPGAGWKGDGISWTPETALFALTAASIGDATSARQWLSFLDAHRTRYGALPEKVLSDGSPAGPAPLTWTASLVVLAVFELPA